MDTAGNEFGVIYMAVGTGLEVGGVHESGSGSGGARVEGEVTTEAADGALCLPR